MDSAPKDGTKILALLTNSDVPCTVYYKARYYWCIAWDDYVLSDTDGPTHWRPLPPPPWHSDDRRRVRRTIFLEQGFPRIVCLCGSTRFSEAFREANLRETLAGNIVLTIGCDMKSDDALGLPSNAKEKLDELHKRKIDLCDEVLVLNVGGYIGESTHSEVKYAAYLGRKIRYLNDPFCPGNGGTGSPQRPVTEMQVVGEDGE